MVGLLLVSHSVAAAQLSSLVDELAAPDETFLVKYEVDTYNGLFQVIQYSDGGLIVLDERGSLVTDPNILRDVYGSVVYNELIGSYGIQLFARSAMIVISMITANVLGKVGSFLTGFGNTVASVPFLSSLAAEVKSSGEEMVRVEEAVLSDLGWLDGWDPSTVGSFSTTNVQKMISSQNSRLNARTNEFQTAMEPLVNYQNDMQAYLTGIVDQGVDTREADAALNESFEKTESARTLASNYLYRAASSALKEAELQVTEAGEIGHASITIHQAELKITEIEKVTPGVWVDSDIQKILDYAKRALRNAKAALAIEPELAEQQAEQAFLAISAYIEAVNAPPPPPGSQEKNQEPPSPAGAPATPAADKE